MQILTQYNEFHLPAFCSWNESFIKEHENSHRMGGKLDAKWDGPYTIEAKMGKGRYQLRSKAGLVLKKLYSSCLLKEYFEQGMK